MPPAVHDFRRPDADLPIVKRSLLEPTVPDRARLADRQPEAASERPRGAADSELRSRAVWIAWQRHRRTHELTRALGLEPQCYVYRGPRMLRHPRAIASTLRLLLSRRPDVVFVQNPSVVLAALVCAIKSLLHFRVVVDRHSNFDFSNTESGLFNLLSNFSLRRADLTIVTNTYVERLAKSKGARALVLPDRLPLLPSKRLSLSGRWNVVCPATFSPDEPIEEIVEAARNLDSGWRVYITGTPSRPLRRLARTAPETIVFTGYLPGHLYEVLLASADLVLALTTRPHTLLCSAYEAISLCKPVVTSRTDVLVRTFYKGTVHTVPSAEAICAALKCAARDHERLTAEVRELRSELDEKWEFHFEELLQELGRLVASEKRP